MSCRVFVSGFVQGVGFRRFARHHALKLGLRGWVKNTSDNRVEAVFQGSKEQIEKIISICKKGAFLSEVKDVVVEWESQSEYTFKTFEILY
jgi:acylphosphatase